MQIELKFIKSSQQRLILIFEEYKILSLYQIHHIRTDYGVQKSVL